MKLVLVVLEIIDTGCGEECELGDANCSDDCHFKSSPGSSCEFPFDFPCEF